MSVEVVLYGAPGCGLCDDARRVLEAAREPLGFALREVDISTDPRLEAAHRHEIPLVTVDGRRAFIFRVEPGELRRQVLAASQSGR